MLNRVNQILGSIPQSSKNNHVTNLGQANSGMMKHFPYKDHQIMRNTKSHFKALN